MSDFGMVFDSIFSWVSAHPISSGLLAVLVTGIGVYSKTILQTIAKDHGNRLLNREEVDEEVFDEPEGALLQNRTREVLNNVTSQDLIQLYGENHPPFQIHIGSTNWVFAASRTLRPAGKGSVRDQKISIVYRDEWFQLDDELNWLTAQRQKALRNASRGENLFNGDPFRIIKHRKHEGDDVLEVGRCKYFDSLRTSFSMDFVLPSQGKSLRDILHKSTGTFGSLDQSRLPNHMGLVVIVETIDGQIIAHERSRKVQVRPGTLSASVSGTFEKNDLVANSGSVHLVDALSGVAREMHGELGGQYSFNPDNFYFMGLMREFRRGGFPDMYFFYQSSKTFDEIIVSSADAEESFEVDSLKGFYTGSQEFMRNPDINREAFDNRVNQLLHAVEGRANLTLSLGIGLYYETTIRRASCRKS